MNKSQVIILYGPIAVGKLTVARLLSEKLGYKLSHNHLINDMVFSLFERETLEGNRVLEKFRNIFYKDAAQEGINFIITHCYSHNYISRTGLSDPEYMIGLEKKFEEHDVSPVFIHLRADSSVLLDRVDNESRKEFGKLTDKKIMEEILQEKDYQISPNVKNNFVIDSSNLTPEETVDKIIELIK